MPLISGDLTKAENAKEDRKDQLLEALGPVLTGDDPNVWFCSAGELANATKIPLSTVRRLLDELWEERLVEVHGQSSGVERVWCHKYPAP